MCIVGGRFTNDIGSLLFGMLLDSFIVTPVFLPGTSLHLSDRYETKAPQSSYWVALHGLRHATAFCLVFSH